MILHDSRNANHRVSVKLLCISNNKSVFLLNEKGKKTYNLVGGGVDKGESLDDAIKREFLEEVGFSLNNTYSLLDVTIVQFDQEGPYDAVANVYYYLKFDQEFELKPEYRSLYVNCGWFTKSDIYGLEISEHSNKELILKMLG